MINKKTQFINFSINWVCKTVIFKIYKNLTRLINSKILVFTSAWAAWDTEPFCTFFSDSEISCNCFRIWSNLEGIVFTDSNWFFKASKSKLVNLLSPSWNFFIWAESNFPTASWISLIVFVILSNLKFSICFLNKKYKVAIIIPNKRTFPIITAKTVEKKRVNRDIFLLLWFY
ncbi:hypothetical protein B5M19_01830 [Mesomycoplasma hyopneumoniae]|nr:hypothetical protein [Mesomycoplasma hyopneumoniae]MXR12842.1 hypothetical protein [Mesomycoplasma hyopneumoniae]MXR33516.1 hypothetical protein [Mesomycoplasma hyopneumoniae]MXR34386.1 hypothetical protein [Mesomycoplasma hyopneumoniae]MXR34860.1 hypothetical protein [Mesomycoplasma hyopneumoniae]